MHGNEQKYVYVQIGTTRPDVFDTHWSCHRTLTSNGWVFDSDNSNSAEMVFNKYHPNSEAVSQTCVFKRIKIQSVDTLTLYNRSGG